MGQWLKGEVGQERIFVFLKIRGKTVCGYVCRRDLREKNNDAGETADNCWKNALEQERQGGIQASRGETWSLYKECKPSSGPSMQAAGLHRLHIVSVHLENTLDICGSFTAEKASFGNTTNIQIFFTINIAKLKLLNHNWQDFEGIMCSGNGQLELVWNEEIKINPKLTSICTFTLELFTFLLKILVLAHEGQIATSFQLLDYNY